MENVRLSLLEMCRTNSYFTDKYHDPNGIDWDPNVIKGAGHCYVEGFYDKLFSTKRDTTINILEIGTYIGGSILLWRDYFPNATIFAADIKYAPLLSDEKRIVQIVGDCYSKPVLEMFSDNLFDIVIDDGSHTLKDMTYFLQNYHTKMKPDGIIVLEDINGPEMAEKLFDSIPYYLKINSSIYDLRSVNGRSDDIAIVINGGFYNG